MTTKKCDTCGRKAKAGWKYCWGCHKTTVAAMHSSGYLTPLDWIKAEERQRQKTATSRYTSSSHRNHQKRIHSEPVAKQVCGEMMPSGKGKK